MAPETTHIRRPLAVEDKLVSVEDLVRLRDSMRDAGERLVQCHGVFDLLHPGHVSHLQQARELGDRVVVSVTADRYVNRGPGRPVFPESVRMSTLAALAAVDFVVLSEFPTAANLIEVIRPDVYCKGQEHADPTTDIMANVRREAAAVERCGGKVRFLGGAVYSSTKLLNQHFNAIPSAAREFAEEFGLDHDREKIRGVLESMGDLKVLVVGDVIIDEYVRCQVQGVTVKDHVPSVRWLGAERYWGGAFAVARHLASCAGSVTLAGIAGPGEDLGEGVPGPSSAAPVERVFEVDDRARTVIKRRYVVENKLREELDKVFSVNHLVEATIIDAQTRKRFAARLREIVGQHDIVVVTDYGHGLLDAEAMDLLQDQAPYLALNCQTNSANFGYNPITKYRRADTFALDQNELHLAFRDRHSSLETLLDRLRAHLSSDVGWLTLGASGSLSVDRDRALKETPALTLHVRDTIGAGDAFFALACLCARLGEPPEVGSFLGNVAGAYAVNVTGNARPVDKIELLKFASTVLNV